MTNREAKQILLENFSVPQISENTEEANIYNVKMQEAFNKALWTLDYIGKVESENAQRNKEY